MKKIIVLFLIIIITGCSNKSLKCSLSMSNKSLDSKKVYKIYYNDSIISKVNAVETYVIFDEKLKLTFDSMVSFIKSNYDSKNLSYSYSNDGNKHVFDVIYDFDSLSDDVFNEMFGTKNISEYRDKLVTQGYTCK